MDGALGDASVRVDRRAAAWLTIGAGALAAATCLVLVSVGDPTGATALGFWSAGPLFLVGAAVLLVLGREREGLPRFRAAGAGVAIFYGAGTVLNALAGGGAAAAPSSVGNLVSLGAVPFTVALLVALPRPAGPSGGPARLTADALVVAVAGALVVSRVLLGDPAGGAGRSPDAVLLAVLALELFFVGYLVGLTVVGHDHAVVLQLMGAVLLLAADLVAVSPRPLDGWQAWAPAVLICLGGPLAVAGALLTDPRPAAPTVGSGAAETRTAAGTVVILCFAGAALFIVASERALVGVDLVLVGALIATLLVREALVQRHRVRDLRALWHLAEHDALTGAGNRRALARVLGEPGDGPRTVVVLDLDGFGAVNDRYGQDVGDALLCAVVAHLGDVEVTRAEVFRLGADDFAVLVTSWSLTAEEVALRCCAAVARAGSSVPGVERLALGAHAGVDVVGAQDARAPGEGWLPVTRAIQALTAAQRAGGSQVAVWGEGLVRAQQRRSRLEERLRLCLAEGSLGIHLQPVVTLATGRLHGFEALSRWHDAVLGPVRPDEFVPVAEDTGMVVDLGAAVVEAALAALVRCDGVTRGLTMAVNASPVELRRDGYVDAVAAALARHGVPTDLLVVEVTEAVVVTPDDPAVVVLEALAAMGVRIAVDDFGTGYSSLAYLTRLPVHVLKIDRSLTASLTARGSSAVVQAAAAMAAGMGLEVVAEGIEDAAQAQALAATGIASGQGWLYSKAVTVQDAVAMVERDHPLGPACPLAMATPSAADAVGA